MSLRKECDICHATTTIADETWAALPLEQHLCPTCVDKFEAWLLSDRKPDELRQMVDDAGND